MTTSRGRRMLAGVAALFAVAAYSALAGPAFAEPVAPSADLTVNLPGPKVALHAESKAIRIDVTNLGPDVAADAKLTIETKNLSPMVTVETPGDTDGCTSAAHKIVCPLGDIAGSGHGPTLGVIVAPVPEDPDHHIPAPVVGPVGTLTVEVSSDIDDSDPLNNTRSVTLELVDNTADPVAYGSDTTLHPGETGSLIYTVLNDGGVDTESVVDVSVRLPSYVTFADPIGSGNFTRCDVMDHRSGIVCHHDAIAGGSRAPAVGLLNVTLAANAPGPVSLAGGAITGVAVSGSVPLSAASVKKSGGGGGTSFAPAAKGLTDKDAKPGDDTFDFTVFTTENPADLAVSAAAASGHLGETVTVPVTTTDKGPADSPKTTVTITAPTGTEIVNAPGCSVITPGKVVSCLRALTIDVAGTVSVKFKIVAATAGADGTAVVGGSLTDPDTGNNTAAITITVVPGGLPVTGARAGLIGGVGLAVVVLGGLLFAVARRRRVVLVVPQDETSPRE